MTFWSRGREGWRERGKEGRQAEIHTWRRDNMAHWCDWLTERMVEPMLQNGCRTDTHFHTNTPVLLLPLPPSPPTRQGHPQNAGHPFAKGQHRQGILQKYQYLILLHTNKVSSPGQVLHTNTQFYGGGDGGAGQIKVWTIAVMVVFLFVCLHVGISGALQSLVPGLQGHLIRVLSPVPSPMGGGSPTRPHSRLSITQGSHTHIPYKHSINKKINKPKRNRKVMDQQK